MSAAESLCYTGYWRCSTCKRGRVVVLVGTAQEPPRCLRYPRAHGMMALTRIDLPATGQVTVRKATGQCSVAAEGPTFSAADLVQGAAYPGEWRTAHKGEARCESVFLHCGDSVRCEILAGHVSCHSGGTEWERLSGGARVQRRYTWFDPERTTGEVWPELDRGRTGGVFSGDPGAER